MSYFEHWLEEQDRGAEAEWERTPEGRTLKLRAECNRLREEKELLEKERDRREQERKWRRAYPTEWRAWVRLQPWLGLTIRVVVQ
ncbi:MAG TPA: hypothetical protein VH092_18010 [Urbifossiella sp.]|nr:hypothetical protein [Urbifossiella sp.]